MDKEEIVRKIKEEDDYIRCPKLGNSLNKFVARNPDGVEDNVIARLLLISEEEIEKIYQDAISKLQEEMVESEEE